MINEASYITVTTVLEAAVSTFYFLEGEVSITNRKSKKVDFWLKNAVTKRVEVIIRTRLQIQSLRY